MKQANNQQRIEIAAKPQTYLNLNRYVDNLNKIPNSSSHIIGHQSEDNIIVYQAYNPKIADYAQEHQKFGGSHFSFNRMSWIKPNFLWMMYRCGWASKENQERVLAIAISKDFFKKILAQGVLSSYQPAIHENQAVWKESIANSEVRIQWDPDHDPYGNKQDWRAIQIGLRGNMLKQFGTSEIVFIQDITDFVKSQKLIVDRRALDEIMIPEETVLE